MKILITFLHHSQLTYAHEHQVELSLFALFELLVVYYINLVLSIDTVHQLA